jgi:hypothetical protein
MPDLYTLICEYDGGTYIAQMSASSPKNAVLSWCSWFMEVHSESSAPSN